MSSQVGGIEPLDVFVESVSPDFSLTGLKVGSVIKTRKLITVEKTLAERKIGVLHISHLQPLEKALSNFLDL
jgi:hypothetical protein